MLVPLRRVRYSIDTLQKNIYEYHHGSSLSLSTNETKTSQCGHSFLQLIEDSCTIIQAIFVRFIFILSTVITVWRLVKETKQVYYWYLLLLLIFLLIETYATVYTRKGDEYKWFCPSAFAYLIAIVPCIWLLELNHSTYIASTLNQTGSSMHIQRRFEYETTLPPSSPSPITRTRARIRTRTTTTKMTTVDLYDDLSDSKENTTQEYLTRILRSISTTKSQDSSLEKLFKTPQDLMSELDTRLSKEEWHMIIEQMTLLVLILSRWLLPKGELSREELSQLLLVYIGIAADIIEFFEVFKEKEVRSSRKLSILVLFLWTLSLLQFCLAFTISRGRKSRISFVKQEYERQSFCSPSDFWGMLMSLFLQDIPFFSFRAVLIFHYHILSYSTVFFTSKNGLIIILQWYRITVILAATISEERQNHHQKSMNNNQTNRNGDLSLKKDEKKISI